MTERTFKAEEQRIHEVTEFVNALLAELNCSPKVRSQIDVAIDEMFCNIARYAYPDGAGSVVVQVDADGDTAVLTFIDSGVPFDPLTRKAPDVTLSAEEREIGGLGIFLTRKLMDEVRYRREDGRNILTLRKRL